jgi:hypothetical protein
LHRLPLYALTYLSFSYLQVCVALVETAVAAMMHAANYYACTCMKEMADFLCMKEERDALFACDV